MKQGWLENILNTIADKGRDILKTGPKVDLRNPARLCDELVKGRHGEASKVALAREMLNLYESLSSEQKLAFFQMLQKDYGADDEAIRKWADSYLTSKSSRHYHELFKAVEAKRQELLRCLNMAPQGTTALVRMRADLLGFCKEQPELKGVDADFKHLLASWFNRGFLNVRSISWDSSAALLEKIIKYEAVHAIGGFDDLRRRLADDRRCFCFSHPAMPGEPLIFVEVALVNGIATKIGPLIDPNAPLGDGGKADTAIFYSINNTQVGLRGISFGNFLIKQVVQELKRELPQLTTFSTLSPLPRFSQTVADTLAGQKTGLDLQIVHGLLALHNEVLNELFPELAPDQALLRLLSERVVYKQKQIGLLLQQLALLYLLSRGDRGAVDPVARFHLANGARLENINVYADISEHGLEISQGLMVNYLYKLDELESNHEQFATTGKVALSPQLQTLERRFIKEHSKKRRRL